MEAFLWIFFSIGCFVTFLLVTRFLFEFSAVFVTKIIALFPKTRKKITLENAKNTALHEQDIALYDKAK
ncbi:MAG: hypothetical protein LBG88_03245 [Christensenellaceae bacterium]|nr:hypothetical protein [Christensenellaceae bacterium]